MEAAWKYCISPGLTRDFHETCCTVPTIAAAYVQGGQQDQTWYSYIPGRMEQSLSRPCNTLSCNAVNPGSLGLLAQQCASPRCTRVLTRGRELQTHSGVQNQRMMGESMSVLASRDFSKSVNTFSCVNSSPDGQV